jgi:U2 small nuclear ribonucleoprotein A'
LRHLILTYNNLEDLHELESLATLTSLEQLSLLRNPVIHKPNYRYFLIYKIPNLRILDFCRIRKKERDKAQSLFGGTEGEEKLKEIKAKTKTFVPGEPVPVATATKGPSFDEMTRIREAIANAKSLDEVKELEALLKAGEISSIIHRLDGGVNGISEMMDH